LGGAVKLLYAAEKNGNTLKIRVWPTVINKEHPLATLTGCNNGIVITTNAKQYILSGPGAGRTPTGTAMMTDFLKIATNTMPVPMKPKVMSIEVDKKQHYIRFNSSMNISALCLTEGVRYSRVGDEHWLVMDEDKDYQELSHNLSTKKIPCLDILIDPSFAPHLLRKFPKSASSLPKLSIFASDVQQMIPLSIDKKVLGL